MTHINLRSRRGTSEPLGFLIALPVWWAAIGIVLVLGLWFWSLAANMIGLTRSGQALAAGHAGEAQRRAYIAAALGGFASDYGQANYTHSNRAVVGSVDATVDIHAFPAPAAITVQARTVSRIEQFYPRPPNGGWE